MPSRFEQPQMRPRHPHAGRLERLRQWWWDQDRRRHIREMRRRGDRRLLDEDYIPRCVRAAARRDRKLPELAL
jgi:hypothetical protein